MTTREEDRIADAALEYMKALQATQQVMDEFFPHQSTGLADSFLARLASLGFVVEWIEKD